MTTESLKICWKYYCAMSTRTARTRNMYKTEKPPPHMATLYRRGQISGNSSGIFSTDELMHPICSMSEWYSRCWPGYNCDIWMFPFITGSVCNHSVWRGSRGEPVVDSLWSRGLSFRYIGRRPSFGMTPTFQTFLGGNEKFFIFLFVCLFLKGQCHTKRRMARPCAPILHLVWQLRPLGTF